MNWRSFQYEKRIDENSKFAEVYRISIQQQQFALKIIPFKKRTKHMDWLKKEVFKERDILRDCNHLLTQQKTQHVPFLFHSTIQRNRTHQNPNLVRYNASSTCMLLFTELATSHALEWIPHASIKAIRSMIFQTLAGFTVLQNEYGLIHNDLHCKNLLYQAISPGGYWHYCFITPTKTFHFYVPNTGQRWIIGDFGQSRRGNNSKKRYYRMIQKDIRYLWEMTPFSPSILSFLQYHSSFVVPAFQLILLLPWFRKKRPSSQIRNRKNPIVYSFSQNLRFPLCE